MVYFSLCFLDSPIRQFSLIRVDVRCGEYNAFTGMYSVSLAAGMSMYPSPSGMIPDFPLVLTLSIAAVRRIREGRDLVKGR